MASDKNDHEQPRRDVKHHILFEVSTEVANQCKLIPRLAIHSVYISILTLLNCTIVGGIYSVIKSKATVTTAEYGDRYTMIGVLNGNSVCV